MKKILSAIFITFVGIFLCGCNISFGVDSNTAGDDVNEKVDILGINKIDISTAISETYIQTYDGSELKIEGKLANGKSELLINKTSGTLTIDERNEKSSFNLFGNKSSLKHSDIKIYVPKSYNGDFVYNAGVGEAKIESLVVNDIKIQGGTGEITLNDITFNKLNVDSGVGEINLNRLKQKGDIKVSGGVGEVNIEIDEVGGNLKFDGGVGEGNIRIPLNAPVIFDTSSGMGECKVDARTSGEDTYKYSLKIGMGSVRVYN